MTQHMQETVAARQATTQAILRSMETAAPARRLARAAVGLGAGGLVLSLTRLSWVSLMGEPLSFGQVRALLALSEPSLARTYFGWLAVLLTIVSVGSAGASLLQSRRRGALVVVAAVASVLGFVATLPVMWAANGEGIAVNILTVAVVELGFVGVGIGPVMALRQARRV